MRTLLLRWHPRRRNLAAGLAIVLTINLLALALLCHVAVPGVSKAGQESCQHSPWLLIPELAIASLTAVAWLSHASRGVHLSEYSLLVFRPPRFLPLQAPHWLLSISDAGIGA